MTHAGSSLRQALLVYDRASQIAELTLEFLLGEGIFPRIAAEVDHLEASKDLARRQLGIAVVPAWSAKREIEAGLLAPIRLGPTGIQRAWGVQRVAENQELECRNWYKSDSVPSPATRPKVLADAPPSK